MINKILCFTWGHVWLEIDKYAIVTYYQFFNRIDSGKYVYIHQCKHCGKMK